MPWFRALAAEPGLDVQVYYAMLPDASQQGSGFGVAFEWDLPLLEGYRWRLLENRAAQPSLDRFRGCDVRNIATVLRQSQTDAALITGWNSLYLLQALWACRRLGIPTLVRGDSNVLAPRGKLKALVQQGLIRQFSWFLAVGKLNRRLYEQAGISSERIFFCPHFVDNERFAEQAEMLRPQRNVLRDRWSIPRNATCFLFAGKLIPKKRVMDFVEAITNEAGEEPSIHGLIVGTGEMMAQAQGWVAERKAPIRFAGFLNQNEIACAYVTADCLVLPSDHGETWGLVVNEAMACGLPAIVSDQVGCGLDVVIEGATGAVFPTGNVAALRKVIVSLTVDRERLKDMGKIAHDLVFAEYTVSRAVAGVLAAVDRVVTGRVSK